MLKFATKRLDGRSVVVEFEDRGNAVPAFDENGNRYEAFTSWFRIDGVEVLYAQIACQGLEHGRAGIEARILRDKACIEAAGIDPDAFDDDLERAMHPWPLPVERVA